ncbi:MAG TPA: glycine cleavage system protein H [Bryobacteraceae bacterium]
MTVILVLATFLAFIALDYVLNRRTAVATVPAEPSRAVLANAGEYIGGFQVPGDRSYHPGHSWLAEERKNVVRVGIDEFAAALLGKLDQISLPSRGQWIRQGQKALSFVRDGKETQMVSPTEGEVLAVNPDVLHNPSLLRRDPYGAGWLFTLNVPDEESTSRNLVPKRLIGDWMREAVDRLYARQPILAGAVAADGGQPAEDLGSLFPDADWKELTGEFFLTA